jgi:hypothetical protein
MPFMPGIRGDIVKTADIAISRHRPASRVEMALLLNVLLSLSFYSFLISFCSFRATLNSSLVDLYDVFGVLRKAVEPGGDGFGNNVVSVDLLERHPDELFPDAAGGD